MPQIQVTEFTSYEFSPEELPVALVFADLNLKHIQHELATAAQTKNLICFDPDAVNAERKFLCEQEYWRGYMTALKYLIATHDATQEAMSDMLKDQIDKQTGDARADLDIQENQNRPSHPDLLDPRS